MNGRSSPCYSVEAVHNAIEVVGVERRSAQPPMTLSRIIPMLPVRDVAAGIAFYEKLGFSVQRKEDGWAWAMLASGDTRIMLDQSINRHPDAPRQSVLYLYVDDIAAYHEQVRANGLDAPDPDVTFYGMKEFRIDDPDGNRLWIGQTPTTNT